MSTPVILREFHLTRDFRQIKWGATLWYNMLRAFCAGVVFAVLMIAFPQSEGDRTAALTMPFAWPFAYLFFFLPFGMVCSLIGQFIPLVNLFTAFLALLAVAIGDPLVCIIHKVFQKAVPVDAPPFFSLRLNYWVLDAPEFSVAG